MKSLQICSEPYRLFQIRVMGEMQANREVMLVNVNSLAAAASVYPKLQETL